MGGLSHVALEGRHSEHERAYAEERRQEKAIDAGIRINRAAAAQPEANARTAAVIPTSLVCAASFLSPAMLRTRSATSTIRGRAGHERGGWWRPQPYRPSMADGFGLYGVGNLSVHAAGGNLARDRQNEADVIYGRCGR